VLFPTPLPDELLYSVVARLRDKVRFSNDKAVLDAIWGKRTGIAVVEFAGAIDKLLARLPDGHPYTADQLLHQHTTLPYYERFVAVHRAADAVLRLRSSGSAGLMELLGIRASTVPTPTHLRFCPSCAAEDEAEHGLPYWRRAHQLPGVLVCTRHGSELSRTSLRRSAPDGRHVFRSLREALTAPSCPETVLPGEMELVASLAQDTDWLLRESAEPRGLAALHQRYRTHLEACGWMRTPKQIRMSELREAFQHRYDNLLLQRLGCTLQGITGDHDWLARLLRKPRAAQHPLHHLLVIRFLGISAEEFFRDNFASFVSSRPADPPLVTDDCPNPVCPTGGAGPPEVMHPRKGVFRCCRCGYTWRLSKNLNLRIQVLSFGSVWEEQLRRLAADRTVSLRCAAKLLGVTPKTVKRHAGRLGVCRPGWRLPRAKGGTRRQKAKATARRHRGTWAALRTQYPDRSTSQLRQIAPAAYSYLYRYDRPWLEQHQPPRPKVVRRATRVDWLARDAEMRTLAEAAVVRILAVPGRPVQLRLGTIARSMGHTTLLQQRSDRLPATRAYIESVIESPSAFAARRLRWAAEEFAAERRVPPTWALVRRAGLRPALAAELRDEIERTHDHFRRLVLQVRNSSDPLEWGVGPDRGLIIPHGR
jgi:hypothetical protein